MFLLGCDDRIMAVRYSIEGDSFTSKKCRAPWSHPQVRRIKFWQQNFDVSPDGKRALMMPGPVSQDTGGTLHPTFLLHFFDEVRRWAPSRRMPFSCPISVLSLLCIPVR